MKKAANRIEYSTEFAALYVEETAKEIKWTAAAGAFKKRAAMTAAYDIARAARRGY
jgi:hypothetical protein